jgi:elongation factor Ts
MAEISAKSVKELRDKTGAGMADCKKALEAANGDMEGAVKWLRERGAAAAAKRADKDAKEGKVVVSLSADAKSAALVEVNCETDFVARGDDFSKFAKAVADLALAHKAKSADAILEVALGGEFGSDSVAKMIEVLTGKLGEKIAVSRVAYFENAEGQIVSYIHIGDKVGALVNVSGVKNGSTIGKDIALQIVSSSPLVIERSQVPRESIDKEIEILRQQAINEGKKEQIVDKIVSGRLEKYYQEVVLLEQPFFRESDKSIKDLIAEASKTQGAPIEVKEFVRFQLGEK